MNQAIDDRRSENQCFGFDFTLPAKSPSICQSRNVVRQYQMRIYTGKTLPSVAKGVTTSLEIK